MIRAGAAGAIAVAFFVFSWILRYNEPEGGFAGLLDDHYFYVVRGWQMLYGEWPDRDFVDIGAPLTYVLSAAAQVVGGRGTWSEIVLCVTLISAAAGLSFLAAARASGSIIAASAATLFHIALAPRFYNHHKLISYALAIPAAWALIDRPTWPRRTVLAAITVLALLLRHDHGVFVAMFVAATVLLTGWSFRDKARELLRFAALTAAIAIPYFVYLQIHGGIVFHFVTANSWSMRDRARAPLVWPAFAADAPPSLLGFLGANLVAWLFYLLLALPFVVAALLWWRRGVADRPDARAKLGGVVALALLLNIGFLRGALGARLADVIVPHTILIAWLLTIAASMLVRGGVPRIARFTIPALIVAAFALPAIPLAANLGDRLGRAHIALDPGAIVGRMQEIRARFSATWPLDAWASPTNNPSMQLIFYLDRCTTPTDRVFVSHYMPQVAALARRAFAGGHPDLRPGFFTTERDQLLFIQRIQHQHVPVLFVPSSEEYANFAADFPLVDRYFDGRYEAAIERDLGGLLMGVRILKGATARGRYEQLDLPCFGPGS